MILGGLNEGVWPPAAAGDPWMSRPMRADFGLPPPELRIGLSAHDFVQCCGAQEVYLTRARRIEGTPTIPARWLQRLDALLASELRGSERAPRHRAGAARLVGMPSTGRQKPSGPRPAPAPTPPVAATAQATLGHQDRDLDRRSLFHLCAGHSCDSRSSIPSTRTRARRSAAASSTGFWTPSCANIRTRCRRMPRSGCWRSAGRTSRRLARGPACSPSGGPGFERIARWFLETERTRRPALQPLATEVQGVLDLEAPAGSNSASRRRRIGSTGLRRARWRSSTTRQGSVPP